MLDVIEDLLPCGSNKWEKVPLDDKFKLFLDVADLMGGKYRQDLNATTMLGQAKTAIQAEIDAAAEMVDFLYLKLAFFIS